MRRLKVGAVSYLNTKPLIRHLPALAPSIDLVLEVPSRLAADLAAGRLDVGLIPSIEYARGHGYTAIPGVSISSHGPVLSVKLCSKVPFDQIKTLALDEGSRTSIALADVLLFNLFGAEPRTMALSLQEDFRASSADAALVIGDRAMTVRDHEHRYVLDLGYEWTRWTGLPFVFAFFAVRPGVEVPPDVIDAFAQAKEMGRPDIAAICQDEASRLGLDEVRCRYYLENVIRHDFGPEEIEGLSRFFALAAERGLAPKGARCVFHGRQRFAESH